MNLKIELVVPIDAGEPFAKVCYTLEGVGPLAPCYEFLSTVRTSIQVKHWANTRALAWMFAAGSLQQNASFQHSSSS